MDELLHDRVQQLKEIQDRIDRLNGMTPECIVRELAVLRWDLAAMIRAAEDEYEAF